MQNKMTPILAIIAVLAIAGIIYEQQQKPEAAKAPEPVEATIVGVFQTQNGDWWTTLSWGTSNRGTWNNKLGQEGERVKIYPIRNGKFALTPKS